MEIEDNIPLTETDKQQTRGHHAGRTGRRPGIAYLNFYVEEEEHTKKLLARVRKNLEELKNFVDIGEGTITQSKTEDKDWINNWKEYFHQFYVDDILIIPSWEEVKAEDEGKIDHPH